jgi:hypothetical protein
MALRLLPDAVRVAVTYLLTVPDVTAIVGIDSQGRAKVGSKLPPEDEGKTLVVQRIGGTTLRGAKKHVDVPVLQIDAWADPNAHETAWRVAETARQALFDMEGKALPSAVVGEVAEVTGPAPFDDPDSDRARVTFRLSVLLHPPA